MRWHKMTTKLESDIGEPGIYDVHTQWVYSPESVDPFQFVFVSNALRFLLRGVAVYKLQDKDLNV